MDDSIIKPTTHRAGWVHCNNETQRQQFYNISQPLSQGAITDETEKAIIACLRLLAAAGRKYRLGVEHATA